MTVQDGMRTGGACCIVAPREALTFSAAEEFADDLELLAHPVRLRLLSILARNGEAVCVCDLEALVPVKQPTVSHHLRLLREAGMIDGERRGLWTYYFVRPAGLGALRDRILAGLSRLEPVDSRPEGPERPVPGSDRTPTPEMST